MKKKLFHAFLSKGWHKKMFRIMRITFILVFGMVFYASASSYSQNTRLSLNMKNATILEMIRDIEAQSRFVFLYQAEDLNLDKKISADFNNVTIEEILNVVLEGEEVSYEIFDRQILISKDEISMSNGFTQQSRRLSGIVTGKDGLPIPGVAVMVKGYSIGTVTDVDGKFVLQNVAPSVQSLVFSFVGMKGQEVSIIDKTMLTVIMEEETVGIGEVIAVGYGTLKRSEITGSISSVKGEVLSRIPVTNISSALAGIAKGVMVFDVDGDVGQDAIIRIRGESTIGDSSPLIVIDGVPGGNLKDVPPDEVASVEILKDAAAATIYGSRGANGVILITTKRGFEGKVQVTYDGYVKFNTVANPLKILDPYSTCFLFNEAQIMDGAAITPYDTPDYKWLKSIKSDYADLIRDTYTYRQKLSIAGGNKQHQFRLSATYDDDQGTFVNNFYKAGTFIFSSDHQLSERFKLSNTFTYRQAHRRNGYAYNTYKAVLAYAPYLTAFTNGNPNLYTELDDSWTALAYSRDDDTYQDNYVFNIEGSYKIMDGLVLSDRFAYKQNNSNQEAFNYKQDVFTSTGQNDNTASLFYTKGSSLLNDVMLNLNRTFGEKHSILGTIVFSTEKTKGSYVSAYRSGLPFSGVPSLNLGTAESATNDGGYSDDTRVGLVGRLGYTYNRKYVAQVSARRDASSRFTPEKRWATFPSVSFAWNIDQEPFIKKFPFITGAKLRASWGKLGRDKLDAYQYYSLVNLTSGYIFNNSQTTGANVAKLAYEGTGWEGNESIDFGIELRSLANRLYFSADYWRKNTVDMIFDETLPLYAGLRNNIISVNGGKILNKGFEFELSWKEKKGDLSYSIGANLSTYKNEVLSWPFGEGVERIYRLGNPRCFSVEKGHPYYAFYLVDAIGIWQSDAEIDAARYHQKDANGNFLFNKDGTPTWGWPNYSKARPAPGNLKFKDQNNDGIIDDNDYVYKGQRYPSVIVGMNANFEYRGFDFSVICQGNFGQSAYIYATAGADSRLKGGATDQYWAYARWTGDGSTNDVMEPRLSYAGSNQWYSGQNNPNEAHLHRTDYLRIKTATLGYTFKQSFLKKMRLSSVRVYTSGFNLLTFTKYPGADPELGGGYSYDSYSNAGVDRVMTYPVPKSYIFGAQINF